MNVRPWELKRLVEDERNRGIPAVVGYGPYLFVAGSDGHRRLSDETIDPSVTDDAIAQCRNSYGRVARRLERAGYSGDAAIWIQNFTSGQHWRLERMALWPHFFGEENHLRAVSFGAQTRMHGINMLTSVVMAIDPAVERRVAVPSPGRGRASRCTRAGDLTFVIGVRGHEDVISKKIAPEETHDSFDVQLDYCVNALESHLSKDGNTIDRFVRVDATLRAAQFRPAYEHGIRRRFGGRIPFAAYAVGTPLGGRGEQEVGGVAAAPGVATTTRWSAFDPTVADSTTAGELTFVRSVSGLHDTATGVIQRDLFGNAAAQVDFALKNLASLLGAAGTSLDRCLRFDVFVRDIYAEDAIVGRLRDILGDRVPALSFIGSEPSDGAELELSAIAAA
jgi:enamine deaminase RidA (YjgF/YER057c/UK114 family)